MRRTCLLLSLFSSTLAGATGGPSDTRAAGGPSDTRAATEQEGASFAPLAQQLAGGAAVPPAQLSVTRAPGDTAWRVTGAAYTAPQRGYRTLCRMNKISYLYAPGSAAPWRPSGAPQQYAWLEPAGVCRAIGQRIRIATHLPDTELARLLENQAAILAKARLLLAGNSACSVLRSRLFSLTTIDVGTLGAGVEEMYELSYLSDRGNPARVQVRKDGQDFIAWNVACPAA